MSLTDADRFPVMTEAAWERLRWLRESDHAPRYTGPCGHRLKKAGVDAVLAYGREVFATPRQLPPGAHPPWLEAFVDFCLREVPCYRRYGARPRHFEFLPTCGRADLAAAPWDFVPDSQPLDDLIVHNTSGTTGHPVRVISHPVAGACYTPLYQYALRHFGVEMQGGADRVVGLLVCAQATTFTYASVMPHLDFAGFAKINLNPNDWHDPADMARFINACAPQVFTGDPLAFEALLEVPLTFQPQALISTAMRLRPALHQRLEVHFGCPVVDVYSMNEAGPVAFLYQGVYKFLQPRLYVEVLDDDGQPCPPGQRGEVTLTGGLNPFLPLLRYRTNDYAELVWREGEPMLADLEGRAPMVFRTAEGRAVNNIDISMALRPYDIAQYTLHQDAAGALHLRVRGCALTEADLRAMFARVFSVITPLTVYDDPTLGLDGQKVVQYTVADPTKTPT